MFPSCHALFASLVTRAIDSFPASCPSPNEARVQGRAVCLCPIPRFLRSPLSARFIALFSHPSSSSCLDCWLFEQWLGFMWRAFPSEAVSDESNQGDVSSPVCGLCHRTKPRLSGCYQPLPHRWSCFPRVICLPCFLRVLSGYRWYCQLLRWRGALYWLALPLPLHLPYLRQWPAPLLRVVPSRIHCAITPQVYRYAKSLPELWWPFWQQHQTKLAYKCSEKNQIVPKLCMSTSYEGKCMVWQKLANFVATNHRWHPYHSPGGKISPVLQWLPR